MGLLIDIPAFVKTISSIWLTLAIVGGLISSKFLAAFLAKLLYRYNTAEMLTMWSLSLPQVAATLAATLVAYETLNPARERLIDEGVLNSVIVLMLVTAIIGPTITARFASLLAIPQADITTDKLSTWWGENDSEAKPEHNHRFTVVVPIYNPQTQRYLIEMAALLARHESGTIVPLAIAVGRVHMDDPRLNAELKECQQRLQGAVEISQEFEVEASPAIRIDDDVALGISRTSREKNATVVVMGWSRTTGLRARIFGSVIDSVFWSSHCPVVVTRLLNSPTTIQHILVPIGDLTSQTIRAIGFAQIIADVNKAEVVLLHVCDRRTPRSQVAKFESQLFEIASESKLQVNINIRTIADDDVAKIIIREAKAFDLVILRSTRYRTAGGLAVSEVTTEVIKELNCSMVLLGEPHS